jgi:hemolysin III
MNSNATYALFSKREEIFNSITHGIGALLGVAALALLETIAGKRGDLRGVVAYGIYGTTLVVLYLSSFLYHATVAVRRKRILRMLDYISIFLLIAGSYTPITLLVLKGTWGKAILIGIWTLALAGIAMTLLNAKRTRPYAIALYFVMGWLMVLAIGPMLRVAPAGLMILLLAGGLFYTFGIIFYAKKSIPFNHGIWHLFVLAGSISHFLGFLIFLT